MNFLGENIMIDIYLITGILISIATTTCFAFMVSYDMRQVRTAVIERVNTDHWDY